MPGLAGRLLLRVRLEGYEESTLTADTRREWAANENPQKGELLAPLQQVGIGRPATMDWTSFTGGTGHVREALAQRCDHSLTFPAATEAAKAFMDAWPIRGASRPSAGARRRATPSRMSGGCWRLSPRRRGCSRY